MNKLSDLSVKAAGQKPAAMFKPAAASLRLVVLVAMVCAALVMAAALVGCGEKVTAENAYETYIQEITSGTMQSGDRTITNYQVLVKADVDWAGMNNDERKLLTDAAVLECRRIAEDTGINDYNIIGKMDGGEGQIFMYDRTNEELIVMVDGAATGEKIPAPAN